MASSYLNIWTGARTVRVVLPSRIHRGRLATSPVWRTTLENGEVWEFQRKKDAIAFAAANGCQHSVYDGRCLHLCRGSRIATENTGSPEPSR